VQPSISKVISIVAFLLV